MLRTLIFSTFVALNLAAPAMADMTPEQQLRVSFANAGSAWQEMMEAADVLIEAVDEAEATEAALERADENVRFWRIASNAERRAEAYEAAFAAREAANAAADAAVKAKSDFLATRAAFEEQYAAHAALYTSAVAEAAAFMETTAVALTEAEAALAVKSDELAAVSAERDEALAWIRDFCSRNPSTRSCVAGYPGN
jgi:hypothetical protein